MTEHGKHRCRWPQGDLMIDYHDTQWGRPRHDDPFLYEMLFLEGFQAGLSWYIVLSKREAFRRAFSGFDPVAIAAYGEVDVARLLACEGIVRNRVQLVRLIVLLVVLTVMCVIAARAKLVPGKAQSIVEMLIEFVNTSIIQNTLGLRAGKQYAPMLITMFFLIFSM